MRSKDEGYWPPVLLDALIPGRFFTKEVIKEYPSAQAILARPHGWKLVWWYWLGYWLFWIVVCAISDSLFALALTAFVLITPFFWYAFGMFVGLTLFFPGTYIMWHWQARSIKAISTHIITESHSREMVLRSRAWLTFWRAVFLPGRDLGHLTHRALGRIAGFLQVACALIAPLMFFGIAALNMLAEGTPRMRAAHDLSKSLSTIFEQFFPVPVIVTLLVLSALLFVTSLACAYKYVTRAAYMNPEERATLTL